MAVDVIAKIKPVFGKTGRPVGGGRLKEEGELSNREVNKKNVLI
jgi:hypothetical protein